MPFPSARRPNMSLGVGGAWNSLQTQRRMRGHALARRMTVKGEGRGAGAGGRWPCAPRRRAPPTHLFVALAKRLPLQGVGGLVKDCPPVDAGQLDLARRRQGHGQGKDRAGWGASAAAAGGQEVRRGTWKLLHMYNLLPAQGAARQVPPPPFLPPRPHTQKHKTQGSRVNCQQPTTAAVTAASPTRASRQSGTSLAP